MPIEHEFSFLEFFSTINSFESFKSYEICACVRNLETSKLRTDMRYFADAADTSAWILFTFA